MRRTKIISTLGPATDSDEMLIELIKAGVNVFRINMSHAPHEWASSLVTRIRTHAAHLDQHVAVLFDLQGPSIRTGDVETPWQLEVGDIVEFRKRSAEPRMKYSTTVNYDGIMNDVSAGKTLVVDNGNVLMEIKTVEHDRIICENKTTGVIGSRRHINLPGVRLNLPALTEKDHLDLDLAVRNDADFIAGSFVRDKEHVVELRSEMEKRGSNAQLVAKIEDQEAIKNLDDIIDASDVIMVARGDLGIEVNVEEMPIIQRRIVKRCQQLGRRVIVATQLLESMHENPLPTRAEVTDVANAVFEEADAVMLSGETSVGKYPQRCVEMLDRIASRIERSGGLGYAEEAILRTEKQKTVRAAITLADSLPGAKLIVFTRKGRMAHQAGLLRPRTQIFAFAPTELICRQIGLTRGVVPFRTELFADPERTINMAVELLRKKNLISEGTPLVIISDVLQKDLTVDSILLHHA